MKRLATLELHKEFMKFSAGHFTIFSATHRENCHGHNFRVFVSLTMPVNDNGMTIDYNYYKKKIKALCQSLNSYFLIPTQSPYLTLNENDTHHLITFDGDTMHLLKRDVKLMPLRNITVEELSYWLAEQLIADKHELQQHQVQNFTVKVYTGPGQAGCTHWDLKKGYDSLPNE